MAKNDSILQFTGSIDGINSFRGGDGRYILRRKIERQGKAKSPLQQRRRVSIANLVKLWSTLTPYLHPSWECKPENLSDYNAYVQANIYNPNSSVYLQKKQVQRGMVVVAPVTLTGGTLGSVQMIHTELGVLMSDINLGNIEEPSVVSVAELSTEILRCNPLLQIGDQITAVRLLQVVENDVPKVSTSVTALTLSLTDEDIVGDIVDDEMFAQLNGNLSLRSEILGGATYIVSRRLPTGTQVSTSVIGVTNPLFDSYNTRDAQLMAIASYAGCKVRYLTNYGGGYLANP